MKMHWKLIIYQKFRVVFQIFRPGNIPKKWFSTQMNLWVSRFKWDWPQTMGTFHFLKNQTETIVQPLKLFLKGCIMDCALFLQKLEASMVGVFLISYLTSKGSFWVLNHFWGIFLGRDIWKTTLNFWSMINLFSMYFQIFSSLLNCNCQNSNIIFETFSDLISKWKPIRRIFHIRTALKWL